MYVLEDINILVHICSLIMKYASVSRGLIVRHTIYAEYECDSLPYMEGTSKVNFRSICFFIDQ